MSLIFHKKDSVIVICAEGQINSSNASAIERELLEQLNGDGMRVVLDLSSVVYVSSAGLRVVLLLAKQIKRTNGILVLCGLQERVREVFEISGFLTILTAVITRENAVQLAEGY